MTKTEVLKWSRIIKVRVAPLLDGEVTNDDVRDVNRLMRKARRRIKGELQKAVNDPSKMEAIYMLYAALTAAEAAIILSHRP